jgi:20S proteasome alpha/beta subunit
MHSCFAMDLPSAFPSDLAPHTGTTVVAVSYDGGVVLGADSRVSTGNYVSNRASDKITSLADNVYLLRSGSAADTQAIADYGARSSVLQQDALYYMLTLLEVTIRALNRAMALGPACSAAYSNSVKMSMHLQCQRLHNAFQLRTQIVAK